MAVLFIGFWSLVVTIPALIRPYIAYVIPVFLRWRLGEAFERGPWTLGAKYRWLNPIAVAWLVVSVIIFSLPFTPAGVPWDDTFSWEAFDYAPVTVVIVILFAAILWSVSGNTTFHSPAEEDAAALAAEIGEPPKYPEALKGPGVRAPSNGMSLGPLPHCAA